MQNRETSPFLGTIMEQRENLNANADGAGLLEAGIWLGAIDVARPTLHRLTRWRDLSIQSG